VRWILVLFSCAVALLGLLCREATPARARRVGGPTVAMVAPRASGPEQAAEEEPETDESAPQDAPETGKCRLFVSLVSLDTNLPVATKLRLYRLDVPASKQWTRGDQLQAEREVPQEGAWFDALPEGEYRVHALGQRDESDDPAAFTVTGDTTSVNLTLPMPRSFTAQVVVVDEHGRPLARAETGYGFSSYRKRDSIVMWLRGRQRIDHRRIGSVRHLSCACCGKSPSGHIVDAWDGAFDLGSWREDSRTAEGRRYRRLHFAGRTDVRVRERFSRPGDHVYIAASVDRRRILDSVFLPDGRLACDAGAKFRTECRAVPGADASRLVVDVRVWLDGFLPMRFEFPPGEDLRKREMCEGVEIDHE